MYHVVHIAGVEELEGLPANWCDNPENVNMFLRKIEALWRDLLYYRSVLLYCKHGAPRGIDSDSIYHMIRARDIIPDSGLSR